MNVYSISSGDLDPNNDYFRLNIAMEPNSYSVITVYEKNGRGVIGYATQSDYIWSVERRKPATDEIVPLAASQGARAGYPNSLPWVPGADISLLSSDDNILTGKIEPGTEKNLLSSSEFLKSGELVPQDCYDRPWSATGLLSVENIYYSGVLREEHFNPPFIDVVNDDIATTGTIEIASSSLEGTIFQMDIKRNFSLKNTPNVVKRLRNRLLNFRRIPPSSLSNFWTSPTSPMDGFSNHSNNFFSTII